MSSYRYVVGVFFAAAASQLGAQVKSPASTPCKRPPAVAQVTGATVVLKEAKTFPCVVHYVGTGVELRTGTDGQGEDIGYEIVRLLDGRFLGSPLGKVAEIAVWNKDGSFMRTLGNAGQGPGEFGVGQKAIRLSQQGLIYVADSNRRLSIFDTSLKLIDTRSTASTGLGFFNSTAVLDDGTMLSTADGSRKSFHIYDLNRKDKPVPPLVREFGPPNPSTMSTQRRLAYRGGKTFWAVSPSHVPPYYQIELWSTDGNLLETVRRDVPWIPPASSLTGSNDVLSPDIILLHEPEDGLLFVGIMVPKKAFLGLSRPERMSSDAGSPLDKAVDFYFEVIDAKAGVVLASLGPIPSLTALKERPIGFFQNGRQGFQRSPDDNGFPKVHIVEVQLLARR